MIRLLQRSLTLVLCIGLFVQAYSFNGQKIRTTSTVELSYFRGMLSNNNGLLIWQTTMEQDNSGFEVQRKTSNGWQTIGFVAGAGTTDTAIKYKFTDENIKKGSNFYRLKIIHLSGSAEFTEMIKIKKKKTEPVISIFPNPATNSFVVTNVNGTATIYNATGAVVKEIIVNQSNQTIDVSSLTEGMYYIEFDQGEELRTTKRFYKTGR